MYFVYILFSDKLQKYYTGQTENLDARIKRHNTGKVTSTKYGVSWSLKWSEVVNSRKEAVLLEKNKKKTRSETLFTKYKFFELKQQIRDVA